MTTMNDMCKRALRRINIVSAEEDLDAYQAADVLASLNAMMHGWKAEGADIIHTTLTGTDDFPLDVSFEDGVVAQLTVRVAPDYGMTPSPFVIAQAASGWDQIAANYSKPNRITMDSGLTRMPSQGMRYWVTNPYG